MEHMSYKEILLMIENACNKCWYNGSGSDGRKTVIECATQIYIAQMKLRQEDKQCD